MRFSAEFHTLLAEQAGNSALAQQMRELSSLTCLIIFLYDAPTATSCRDDEHEQIVEAIPHRDVARAQALILEHLEHIEGSLAPTPGTGEMDLEAIFPE